MSSTKTWAAVSAAVSSAWLSLTKDVEDRAERTDESPDSVMTPPRNWDQPCDSNARAIRVCATGLASAYDHPGSLRGLPRRRVSARNKGRSGRGRTPGCGPGVELRTGSDHELRL